MNRLAVWMGIMFVCLFGAVASAAEIDKDKIIGPAKGRKTLSLSGRYSSDYYRVSASLGYFLTRNVNMGGSLGVRRSYGSTDTETSMGFSAKYYFAGAYKRMPLVPYIGAGVFMARASSMNVFLLSGKAGFDYWFSPRQSIFLEGEVLSSSSQGVNVLDEPRINLGLRYYF